MSSEVNKDLLRVIAGFILADKVLAGISLQDALEYRVDEALLVFEEGACGCIRRYIVGVKDLFAVMRTSCGDS